MKKYNLSAFRKKVKVSIEDVFESSPGVYYYVICRSPESLSIQSVVQQNIKAENYDTVHRGAIGINNIPLIKPALNILKTKEVNRIIGKLTNISKKKGVNLNTFFTDGVESFRSNPTIDSVDLSSLTPEERAGIIIWSTEYTLKDPNRLSKIHNNVLQTRRKSLVQQDIRHGGKRRKQKGAKTKKQGRRH